MKKEEDRTIRDANITLPMKNTFKKILKNWEGGGQGKQMREEGGGLQQENW